MFKELIKELVRLSTRHGILTPYTSFLADDQAELRELADARRGGTESLERSSVALDRLREVDGQAAFSQRALKQRFQAADNAAYQAFAPSVGQPVSAADFGGAVVFDLDKLCKDDDFSGNVVYVIGPDGKPCYCTCSCFGRYGFSVFLFRRCCSWWFPGSLATAC